MDTTTVAPEVETPRHFADCDSLAIGRRVKAMVAEMPDGHDLVISLRSLTSLTNIDPHRDCSCFALQLTRVEADLATRRKAQRAGFDRGEEIAALLIARDALRQVVAR